LGKTTWLAIACLAPLVWLVPHFTGAGHGFEPGLQSLLAGFAIVGAAFMLGWAVELAEEFVPPSFALIVLALVAVLPEYAVDMHFAWEAGIDPKFRDYAVANMTGANRVLVGVGWSMLVFVLVLRTGKRQLEVQPAQRLELGFLLLVTIYSLVLPIKGTLSLFDTAVFFSIFALYVWKALHTEQDARPLVGPAAMLRDHLGRGGRIALSVTFLVYACATIWFGSEPFAEGLVEVGGAWGVDEFILIQLVGPLASEAPEFIVALLFVLRHRASTALGALVSSKVNQWTLLVGAIPLVYGISHYVNSGTFEALELQPRPKAELLLTSAQSLFAIAVLADLSFSLFEACALLTLYVVPWFLNDEAMHYGFAVLYFVMVFVVGFRTKSHRRDFARLLRLRG
jgi:cation:H+ antiporter